MTYLIVEDGIITNVIVADEDFANQIGAFEYYEGAGIGETYNPPEPDTSLNLKISDYSIYNSYWNLIKNGRFKFDDLTEEEKFYVRRIAKEDVVNKVITKSQYYDYIGEVYISDGNLTTTDLGNIVEGQEEAPITLMRVSSLPDDSLPAKEGYIVVEIEGKQTYRNILTGLTIEQENELSQNLSQKKENKTKEIKNSCEENIVKGFDADVLGRGDLHYSLTLTKQNDLKVLMQNILAGAESVLWHDDSKVMHEVYTAEQFKALYEIGYSFMIMCKIYSDGLEQMAVNYWDQNNEDEALKVVWGSKLSEDIQAIVDTQIKLMLSIDDDKLNQLKQKFRLMI